MTGLRNPCAQLDRIQPGLMGATLERDPNGNLVRKAGIMADRADRRRCPTPATRSASSSRRSPTSRWPRYDTLRRPGASLIKSHSGIGPRGQARNL